MRIDVGSMVAELGAMTVPQLRDKYAEAFGEPTRCRHKRYLIKRIVWREQALLEGGLSQRATERALELARDTDIRLTAPLPRGESDLPRTAGSIPGRPDWFPPPGTVLRREYKDRVLVVRVLRRGFEFDGQVFKSLTAVARRATGTHWNGIAFFGLRPPTPRRAAAV